MAGLVLQPRSPDRARRFPGGSPRRLAASPPRSSPPPRGGPPRRVHAQRLPAAAWRLAGTVRAETRGRHGLLQLRRAGERPAPAAGPCCPSPPLFSSPLPFVLLSSFPLSCPLFSPCCCPCRALLHPPEGPLALAAVGPLRSSAPHAVPWLCTRLFPPWPCCPVVVHPLLPLIALLSHGCAAFCSLPPP